MIITIRIILINMSFIQVSLFFFLYAKTHGKAVRRPNTAKLNMSTLNPRKWFGIRGVNNRGLDKPSFVYNARSRPSTVDSKLSSWEFRIYHSLVSDRSGWRRTCQGFAGQTALCEEYGLARKVWYHPDRKGRWTLDWRNTVPRTTNRRTYRVGKPSRMKSSWQGASVWYSRSDPGRTFSVSIRASNQPQHVDRSIQFAGQRPSRSHNVSFPHILTSRVWPLTYHNTVRSRRWENKIREIVSRGCVPLLTVAK